MSRKKIQKSKPVKKEPAYMNVDQDKTLHCANCNYSIPTQNSKKPLTCNSEIGKKLFGSKAGNDTCAITCTGFIALDDASLMDA